MNTINQILLAIIAFCAQSNADSHPIVSRLIESADVVVVAKYQEPHLWFTSGLIDLTGSAEAHVEKTLVSDHTLEKNIRFEVTRYLEIETDFEPAVPSELLVVPHPSDFDKLPSSIIFLRRSANGTLSAEDGFSFALPYSVELERVVASKLKKKAERAGAGQPATKPADKTPAEVQPSPPTPKDGHR